MLTRMEAERISVRRGARRRAGQGLRRSRSDRRPRRLRRARQAVRAGPHRPARRAAPGRRAVPLDPAAQGRRLRLRPAPRLHHPPGVARRAPRAGRRRAAIGRRRRRAGAGQERLGAVAGAGLREPGADARRARRRDRLLRPRRRRRSDGGRGALGRALDRAAHVAARLVPRGRRRSTGRASNHDALSAHYLRLRRPRQAGHHRRAGQRARRATTSTSTPCCRKAAGRRTRCRSWSRSSRPRRELVDRAIDEIAPLDFHVERPVCLPIVE